MRFRSLEDEQRRQWSHLTQSLGQQVSLVKEAAERAARKEVSVATDRLREDLRDLVEESCARCAEDLQGEVRRVRSSLDLTQNQVGSLHSGLDGLAAEIAAVREEALVMAAEQQMHLEIWQQEASQKVLRADVDTLRQEPEDAHLLHAQDNRSEHKRMLARQALRAEALQVRQRQPHQQPGSEAPRLTSLMLEGDLVGLRADVEELRAICGGYAVRLDAQEAQLDAMRSQVRGQLRNASSEVSRERLALVEAVLRREVGQQQEEFAPQRDERLGRFAQSGREAAIALMRSLQGEAKGPMGLRISTGSAEISESAAHRPCIEDLREDTLRHLARLALRVEYSAQESPASASAAAAALAAAASALPPLPGTPGQLRPGTPAAAGVPSALLRAD